MPVINEPSTQTPESASTETPFDTTLHQCFVCGENRETTSMLVNRGSAPMDVCGRCIDEEITPCDECGRMYTNSNLTHVENGSENMCGTCCSDAEVMSCNRCHSHFTQEAMIGEYCISCAERNEQSIVFRQYRETSELQGNTIGKYILNNRPFGIELEIGVSSEKNRALIARKVPPFCGVTTDGSINLPNGLEVITPPASGDKGEGLIQGICSVLHKYKAVVNQSCGYHLHIGLEDLKKHAAQDQFRAVQCIWLFYILFEDVIKSFLSKSRRINGYCKSLATDYHYKEIRQAQNMGQLDEIWYRVTGARELASTKAEHKHDSRYRGINMHTLLSEWHLEIRYHMGTTIPDKILHWAGLHTGIIEWCLSHGIDSLAKGVQDSPDLADKTQLLFSILTKKYITQKTQDYFLTRQNHFATKDKVLTDKEKAEGEALLSAEEEK